MSRTASLIFAAIACALSGLSLDALAGAFTISPIRIELSPRAPMVAVTVRNNDPSAPAVIQTQAMSWSQEGGEDVYQDSRALVVSPPIFTLKAGGEQVVRIALRGAPPAEREALYRVYFQELPGTVEEVAGSERKPALRMVLRMGIPIIVAPAKGVPSGKPEFRLERTTEGRFRVVLRNDGTGHLRVTGLVVANAKTGAEVTKAGSFYVLPGQWWASNDFPVADVESGGEIRVTASTQTGDLDTTLHPDAR
jgi:fimbrial chaperone protein